MYVWLTPGKYLRPHFRQGLGLGKPMTLPPVQAPQLSVGSVSLAFILMPSMPPARSRSSYGLAAEILIPLTFQCMPVPRMALHGAG